MLDELEVNSDGTLQRPIVSAWEQAISGAIDNNMTAVGELSAVDGSGCEVFIDPTQDVVSTSRIDINVSVRPHGYARFIDVKLGFTVNS
jgi:hypothetical protein